MALNRRLLALCVCAFFVVVSVAGGLYVATQQQHTDCPPRLSVWNDATETADSVVQYRDLSDQRRAEFRDALGDDSVEINGTYGPWVETDVVRYEGENYSVAVAVC